MRVESFPGSCPRCSHPLRVLGIPGDQATGRKRFYVVACSDNPKGCGQPSETLNEVIKRRYVARTLPRLMDDATFCKATRR